MLNMVNLGYVTHYITVMMVAVPIIIVSLFTLRFILWIILQFTRVRRFSGLLSNLIVIGIVGLVYYTNTTGQVLNVAYNVGYQIIGGAPQFGALNQVNGALSEMQSLLNGGLPFGF